MAIHIFDSFKQVFNCNKNLICLFFSTPTHQSSVSVSVGAMRQMPDSLQLFFKGVRSPPFCILAFAHLEQSKMNSCDGNFIFKHHAKVNEEESKELLHSDKAGIHVRKGQEIFRGPRIYPVGKGSRRGKLLLANFKSFPKESQFGTRDGSERDVENLKELFSQIGGMLIDISHRLYLTLYRI